MKVSFVFLLGLTATISAFGDVTHRSDLEMDVPSGEKILTIKLSASTPYIDYNNNLNSGQVKHLTDKQYQCAEKQAAELNRALNTRSSVQFFKRVEFKNIDIAIIDNSPQKDEEGNLASPVPDGKLQTENVAASKSLYLTAVIDSKNQCNVVPAEQLASDFNQWLTPERWTMKHETSMRFETIAEFNELLRRLNGPLPTEDSKLESQKRNLASKDAAKASVGLVKAKKAEKANTVK